MGGVVVQAHSYAGTQVIYEESIFATTGNPTLSVWVSNPSGAIWSTSVVNASAGFSRSGNTVTVWSSFGIDATTSLGGVPITTVPFRGINTSSTV